MEKQFSDSAVEDTAACNRWHYTEMARRDETQNKSHSLKTAVFSQKQEPNRAEGKWRIS